MSIRLDHAIKKTGTKFRLFTQPRFLSAFREPETIIVSLSPESINEGPSDDRFYVVDAINKKPYSYPYMPPHEGLSTPPVKPDAKTGHFDHLDIDSRGFKAAHMYACVRRVLDIWEDYFESRIEWHFRLHFERMELIPLIFWGNAHSGYGFLEFGYGSNEWGEVDKTRPYCMNFDVLAHELGHSFVYSKVGYPNANTKTHYYGGFHEAIGALVALISTLHFDKVVDHLLEKSKGNLFSENEVSRIGELSESRQIRKAFNYERMSTVSQEPHDLSKPLTGAIFDIMVEVFQKTLVEKELISKALADESYHGPEDGVDDSEIHRQFEDSYRGKEKEFKLSLLEARDYLGDILSKVLNSISPHNMSYVNVGNALISADVETTGGIYNNVIRDCFAWREIGISQEEFMMQDWKLSDCGLQQDPPL